VPSIGARAALTPRLALLAQVIVYLANNWKLVLALQEFVLGILKPLLNAQEAKKEQAARSEAAAAQAKARKARAARLKKAAGTQEDD
jgi:hypothetical protein